MRAVHLLKNTVFPQVKIDDSSLFTVLAGLNSIMFNQAMEISSEYLRGLAQIATCKMLARYILTTLRAMLFNPFKAPKI